MNIYDELSRESLKVLADEARKKIAAKNTKLDGKTCIWCTNFCPYAENNFGDIFLCYSCNNYMNRVILGLS